MHTPLAPLTLRPQPPEPHFQLTHFRQCFGVEFPDAGSAVLADGARHLRGGAERLFAAHACEGFFREFHEAAQRGHGDGDGARVFAREELTSLFFAEDGVEDSREGFGELVVEIVFRVDGQVVLEHEDGIFGAFVVFGTAGALDDDIGDAVAQVGCGPGVAFAHAFGEFDVRLFGDVIGFREGFCDDEVGHVDFVLEEGGYHVFYIAGRG